MKKLFRLYILTCGIAFLLLKALHVSLSFFIDNAAMFEFINPIEEDWYMKAYFDYVNKHSSDSIGYSEIAILSVEDSAFTRKNIAGVLQMLRKVEPKPPAVVGIDIPFTDSYSDKESDSLLSSALQSLVDDSIKVVCAVTQDKDSMINYPFFYSQLNGVNFGLTTHDNLDLLSYDSYLNGVPRFATKIAEVTIDKNLGNINNIIINFRNKKIIEGNPIVSNFSEINDISSMTDLAGKIVLIGNENDQTDQKFLPFITTENNQISGIRLIAYEICTLIAESKGYNKQLYCPYESIPIWLFVLLLIVFSILCFMALFFEGRMQSQLLATILDPILLIVFEIILFFACRLITGELMYIPNFAYLFCFIVFMSFSYKIACEINIKLSLWENYLKSFRCFCFLDTQSK